MAFTNYAGRFWNGVITDNNYAIYSAQQTQHIIEGLYQIFFGTIGFEAHSLSTTPNLDKSLIRFNKSLINII